MMTERDKEKKREMKGNKERKLPKWGKNKKKQGDKSRKEKSSLVIMAKFSQNPY